MALVGLNCICAHIEHVVLSISRDILIWSIPVSTVYMDILCQPHVVYDVMMSDMMMSGIESIFGKYL